MAELLSIDERTWLLDELRELVSKRGAQTFLAAPLLTPSPSDSPDPFEPTARGVRVNSGSRLYAYMRATEAPHCGHLGP